MNRLAKFAVVPALSCALALTASCDDGEVGDEPDDASVVEREDFDAPTELADEGEANGWWGNPNGNCKGIDRYPEHGVYESTVVYSIDETLEPGVDIFPPMDADRNTLEYRTFAYDFFAERYGLDVDPNDPNDQFISDGLGGQALVRPIKTGVGDTSTHQVYAVDAQHVPQWRNKIPLTNVAFRDDGFFVFVISDFVTHGTYGGDDGLRVRAGDLIVAGEYRMFDHKDRLLDTVVYKASTPATVNPFNGAEEASDGATFVSITCDVESEVFGPAGTTRGIGEIRPLPDGSTLMDFRYVMHFPTHLDDSDVYSPNCKKLRPLQWW